PHGGVAVHHQRVRPAVVLGVLVVGVPVELAGVVLGAFGHGTVPSSFVVPSPDVVLAARVVLGGAVLFEVVLVEPVPVRNGAAGRLQRRRRRPQAALGGLRVEHVHRRDALDIVALAVLTPTHDHVLPALRVVVV